MAGTLRPWWPTSLLLLVLALPAVARADLQPTPASPSPSAETSPEPSPAPLATPATPSPPPLPVPAAPSPPPVAASAAPSPPPVPAPPAPGYDKPSLTLSGFVAAQVTFDSNDAVRQNHLISVDGDGNIGRFSGAFDATRLNLVGQLGVGGFTMQGRAEADMESNIYFRIRHAYAAISKRGTSFLVGQTDTLVGNQVGPHNFNNDWMFAQGNAYDRLLQVRFSHETARFLFAAALLPNLYGASDVIPHAQARIMLRFKQGLLGAAGHFGYSNRVKNPTDANQLINGVLSYLASLDAGLSLGPVTISTQLWVGAGAAHGTGGHAIGNPLFVVTASGAPASVPSAGGFLDIFVKTPTRLALGAAGGASVITDTAPGGVRVPLSSNATAVLYATFSLFPYWVFAFEAQGARTERSLDLVLPSAYTPLYNGRLLFGQKLSF